MSGTELKYQRAVNILMAFDFWGRYGTEAYGPDFWDVIARKSGKRQNEAFFKKVISLVNFLYLGKGALQVKKAYHSTK